MTFKHTSKGSALVKTPAIWRSRMLPLHGRRKHDLIRGVIEAPGVVGTLRWLLRMSPAAPVHTVLRRASVAGIVTENLSAHWRVSEPTIERLLRRPNLTLPTSPSRIAELLLGLGELSARCHLDIEALVGQAIVDRARGKEQAILFAAFDAALANARSVSLADHSAAQSLSAPCLSWQLLRVAKSFVMHPMDIGSTPRYGLQSVVRLILAWKSSAIRALVDRECDHPLMSAIVRAAVQYLHPPSVGRVRAVAATGCPLLVAIAAASMADQPAADLNETTTCFADGWHELVAAGAAEADATWLMALHLKEAVHQRFRYTHGIEDDTRLLRWLRRKAPDLSNCEHHRLGHVTEELLRRREAAAIHEHKLDRILDDMARLWPVADLSVTQYQWLAQAFVDSAEIRHRLATRVAAASERTMLLKQNVEAWKAEVGLGRSSAEPFTEEYLPQLDTLFQQTLWAARSFVDLNKNAKRGVGREVGLLLDPLTRDAQTILKEPFMAARRPARWQAALLRSAACALFALIVIGETPDDRRADVQVLASHALASAKVLVSESERIGASWELIYLAASIAITVMADDALLSGQLAMWAQDSDLPMQVRAMAAWSSDDLLTRRLADASSLFAMAAKSPLLRASRDRHFSQLMSLLDVAVVSTMRLSNCDIADRLRSLWSDAIMEWPEQMEEWATAADWLMDAVKADGPQRVALLEHPSFASSRCRGACMVDQAVSTSERQMTTRDPGHCDSVQRFA